MQYQDKHVVNLTTNDDLKKGSLPTGIEDELDKIVEKIKLIIQLKGWQPSKFADEIGVQRSSVSHILSGRNKPSLDLVLKILDNIKDVNPNWLLRNDNEPPFINLQDDPLNVLLNSAETPVNKTSKLVVTKEIDKVIVIYTDKTFDVMKSIFS